jgi:dipeptidyl aminopeptidase/acylaminoacyl peptidase
MRCGVKIPFLFITIALITISVSCSTSAEPEATATLPYPLVETISHDPTDEALRFTPTTNPTSTPMLNAAIAVPTFTPVPPLESSPTIQATTASVEPTATESPFFTVGENDVIVYASNMQANRDIYIAMIRTENHWPRTEVRLTDYYGEDTLPDLSPDGRYVAFVSDRSGNRDIYILEIETQELKRLTYHYGDDSNPAWSPDGSKIAFHSNRDGNNEIYTIETKCAEIPEGCPDEVIRLTNIIYDDLEPEWSPDGEKIAFMSARDGNLEIYTMNSDGTKVTRLTYNPGIDGFPTWSPDGSMIAYHSARDENIDIYVMRLENQEEWRITESSNEQEAPYWCGNAIIFMSRGQNYNLAIVFASSSGSNFGTPQILRSGTSSAFDGFPSCGRPGFNTSRVFP